MIFLARLNRRLNQIDLIDADPCIGGGYLFDLPWMEALLATSPVSVHHPLSVIRHPLSSVTCYLLSGHLRAPPRPHRLSSLVRRPDVHRGLPADVPDVPRPSSPHHWPAAEVVWRPGSARQGEGRLAGTFFTPLHPSSPLFTPLHPSSPHPHLSSLHILAPFLPHLHSILTPFSPFHRPMITHHHPLVFPSLHLHFLVTPPPNPSSSHHPFLTSSPHHPSILTPDFEVHNTGGWCDIIICVLLRSGMRTLQLKSDKKQYGGTSCDHWMFGLPWEWKYNF